MKEESFDQDRNHRGKHNLRRGIGHLNQTDSLHHCGRVRPFPMHGIVRWRLGEKIVEDLVGEGVGVFRWLMKITPIHLK